MVNKEIVQGYYGWWNTMITLLRNIRKPILRLFRIEDVAVHLGVKMADTLSFTAKVDMVDFWVWDPKAYQNLTKQNAKRYSPSQVWPQIMCHTHSWLQQKKCCIIVQIRSSLKWAVLQRKGNMLFLLLTFGVKWKMKKWAFSHSSDISRTFQITLYLCITIHYFHPRTLWIPHKRT